MNRESQMRSVRKRINNIAKKNKQPITAVVTDFLIERIVARLTQDATLAKHLVFKGGYVGLKCYESPRYTVDLDAIAHKRSQKEIIEITKRSMLRDMDELVWFEFEKEIDLTAQSEYGGTRLQYRGDNGDKPEEIKRAQIIKIDIGVGDPVTPAPKKSVLEGKLGGDSISWQVYPIATIASEKIHCLISRGSSNSKSKDIFDLSFYLPKCDPNVLKEALNANFTYRGDVLPQNLYEEVRRLKTDVLERGWPAATALMSPKPDFKECFGEILSWLRKTSDFLNQ